MVSQGMYLVDLAYLLYNVATMMGIIGRILINSIALVAAAWMVPGMHLTSDWVGIVIVAVIFGLVNTLIKPMIKLLILPLILLTFGLFAVLVNTAMLSFTAWITDYLALDGFGAALMGAIVISIVSAILNVFVRD